MPAAVLAMTVRLPVLIGSVSSVGLVAGAVTTKLPFLLTFVALSAPYCAFTAV